MARARRRPPRRSRASATSDTSSCPAPGCSPPACRARSTRGSCCCATSGRCRWQTCSSPRSAMRRTATRSCPGSVRTSRRWSTSSATSGPGRPGWICRCPGPPELSPPGPEPGTLFRNRDLASTSRQVLAESGGEPEAAREVFYRGFVAEAIDGFSREPGGLLDGDDLASWRASIKPPVTRGYHGWEVSKTGPWGQGPVFLQQLALLDGFELGEREGPDFVHTVVECAKLAFADREAWYGDGDGDVPLDALLSAAYADERRKLVSDEAS